MLQRDQRCWHVKVMMSVLETLGEITKKKCYKSLKKNFLFLYKPRTFKMTITNIQFDFTKKFHLFVILIIKSITIIRGNQFANTLAHITLIRSLFRIVNTKFN